MIRSLLMLIVIAFICLLIVNIGNECLWFLLRLGIRRVVCDVLVDIINRWIAFDPLVFFFLRKNYI